MAGAIEVRLLRPDDDRSGFESGDMDLDRFFRLFAGQNQFRHHIGATYVAVDRQRIQGFATIAAGHIEIEDLPKTVRKRLPHYPLPIHAHVVEPGGDFFLLRTFPIVDVVEKQAFERLPVDLFQRGA